MPKVDSSYNSSSRPRSKLTQRGGVSLISPHPPLTKLQAWESLATYEPVILIGLNTLLESIFGALDPLQHPDPEIQKFLDYNQARINEEHGIDLENRIRYIIRQTMWAGYSCSECLYEVHDGALLLLDLVNYHPSTIIYRLNQQGRLTEGEPAYLAPGMVLEGTPMLGAQPFTVSGIYQHVVNSPTPYRNLPMWKVLRLANNETVGNYYGTSIVDACWRWHVLKEGITDMMLEALDRFGNPMMAVTMPNVPSGVREYDPETGEERNLSSTEWFDRQVSSGEGLRGGNIMMLNYSTPELKPEIEILSGNYSVGPAFLDSIKYAELQMTRSLLLPYGFVEGHTTKDTQITERQIETFNRIISSLYRMYIRPYCSQVWGRVIRHNFNRESAKINPIMPFSNSLRPEDRVGLMQMLQGVINVGLANPLDERDWKASRDMLGFPRRDQTPEDLQFIEDTMILPKLGAEFSDNTTPGAKRRNRKVEGKVNGKSKKGRPIGNSTPLNIPRE